MKVFYIREFQQYHLIEDLCINVFSWRTWKSEGNALLEKMIKVVLNASFGQKFEEDIEFKHEYKTGKWIKKFLRRYSWRISKIQDGCYSKRFKNDEGIDDDETTRIDRMPLREVIIF